MEIECRGCSVYHGEASQSKCLVQISRGKADLKDCPCRICLVKGICSDPCQDFVDFLKTSKRKG